MSTILRTTNGGETWTQQTVVTQYLFTGVSFTDENNGTIVGENGTIFRTTNGGITFVKEEKSDEIPENYFLSSNFPNPFNPDTKIRYFIPHVSFVQIRVYDVLGNEIETLVNDEKPAGNYELTWKAANLSSGVYFYQIRAIDPSTSSGQVFIQTRKMILLK